MEALLWHFILLSILLFFVPTISLSNSWTVCYVDSTCNSWICVYCNSELHIFFLFSRTTDTRRVASGRNSVCKHAGETYIKSFQVIHTVQFIQ